MKNIILEELSLQNFKGHSDLTVRFEGSKPVIFGANATGKTSIIDAFHWLLFDHDSAGNSKFGIRPVDESGKDIDNTEISVTGKFRVEEWKNVNDVYEKFDSSEIEFKKVQKQKWTKHRGSSAPAFEGNVNSFEIDGFPQSKAEYQKRIAELIPEETFRLVADLRYFSNLDWKEKRKLLLSLCGDVTDMDVFANDPDYWEPIKADVEAAGVDKAREKAKKALRELNKQQNEIPVRIDEITKMIREVPDVSGVREELARAEREVEEITAEIEKVSADSSVPMIEKKIQELEARRASVVHEANKEAAKKHDDYQLECRMCDSKIYSEENELKVLQNKRLGYERELNGRNDDLNTLSAVFHSNQNPVPFDESAKTCRYCGQMLPQNRIDEIIQRHNQQEEERKRKANDAIANGKKVKARIVELETLVSSVDSEIESQSKKIDSMKDTLSDMFSRLHNMPTTVPTGEIPGYLEISNEIKAFEERLSEAKNSPNKVDELIERKNLRLSAVKAHSEAITASEAIRNANEEAQNRIGELKATQRETGQRIALTEQKLILLEEFSMKKSELLSQKITSCFKLANFSLFSQQINGGLVEECEITLKGVKYKDMNSGHRIVVAMDIIRSFSEKLGVCAPLFIDNAETVNDFNLPEMPCQLILLKVSDDPALRIEGGTIA